VLTTSSCAGTDSRQRESEVRHTLRSKQLSALVEAEARHDIRVPHHNTQRPAGWNPSGRRASVTARRRGTLAIVGAGWVGLRPAARRGVGLRAAARQERPLPWQLARVGRSLGGSSSGSRSYVLEQALVSPHSRAADRVHAASQQGEWISHRHSPRTAACRRKASPVPRALGAEFLSRRVPWIGGGGSSEATSGGRRRWRAKLRRINGGPRGRIGSGDWGVVSLFV
jgi:hypothetical protein